MRLPGRRRDLQRAMSSDGSAHRVGDVLVDPGLRLARRQRGRVVLQLLPAGVARGPEQRSRQAVRCELYAAPDLDGGGLAHDLAAGSDPSFPAFWLPFQDVTAHNHIAQWVDQIAAPPSGCQDVGQDCTTKRSYHMWRYSPRGGGTCSTHAIARTPVARSTTNRRSVCKPLRKSVGRMSIRSGRETNKSERKAGSLHSMWYLLRSLCSIARSGATNS